MSILIKGMEMPECCGYCPFEYKNYCMAKPSLMVESTDRHPRCPLIPVPPHGDLIDRDALMNHEVLFPMYGGGLPIVYSSYIRNASTIIPASEEGE